MGGSRSKIVLVLGFTLVAAIGVIHTNRRQAGHEEGEDVAVSANSANTKRFKRDLKDSWKNPLDLSLNLRHEKSSKNSSDRICRPKPAQSDENVDKKKSVFKAWHLSNMENSFDMYAKDNDALLKRIISLCIVMPKEGNLVNIGANKDRLLIFVDGEGLSESTLVADLNMDESDGEKTWIRTHNHYTVTQIRFIADNDKNISVIASPHYTPLTLKISPANEILGLKNKKLPGDPLDTKLIELALSQLEWNFIRTARKTYRRQKHLANHDKGKESQTSLKPLVDSILDDIYCSQGKGDRCEKNNESGSGGKGEEKPKAGQRIIDATKFVTEYSLADESERERLVNEILADKAKLVGDEEEVKMGKDIIQRLQLNKLVQTQIDISTLSSKTYAQIQPELVGEKIILSRNYVASTLAKLFANNGMLPRITTDPANFELNKELGAVMSKDRSPVLSHHLVTVLNEVVFKSYELLKKPLHFWHDSAPSSAKRIMMAAPLGGETSPGYSVYSLYKAAGEELSSGKNDAVSYMVENAAEMVLTLRVEGLDPSGSAESPFISIESTLVIQPVGSRLPFYKVQHCINILKPHASFRDLQHRGPSHENTVEEGILLKRHPDYVQEFITTKITNDRESFLRNNHVLAGIVFPSNSIIASMTCTMKESICTLRPPLVPVPRSFEWDPADCRPHVKVSCDTGVCEIASREDAHKCYAAQRPINASMYHRHLCRCDVSETAVVPTTHQNNRINFSDKSWIFLKRLDAKDNIASTFRIYKCKYGASASSDDYLCEDIQAILRRGKITPEQIMLYDLEDGDDEIRIPEGSKRINYYRITTGRKTFYGGNGTDIFDLVSPCDPLSGLLDGGGGQNHLILSRSSECDQKIHINFIAGHINTSSIHQINIANLQIIQGRQNEPEIITLSPNITRVDSGGGSSHANSDQIRITQDSSTNSLPYNTTIIASGYTRIVSDARNAGKIVIVLDDNQRNMLTVDVHAPGSGLTISTHFKNLVPQNLTVKAERLPNNIISVTIQSQRRERSTYRFNLNFLDNLETGLPSTVQGLNFAFFGSSSSDPTSILILNLAPLSTAFYHLLTSPSPEPSHSTSKIQGATATQNIFDLLNGTWTAIGGSEDDEFILHQDIANGSVLRGMGGNNTLMFHKSLQNESFEVDLVTGSSLNGRLQIFDVQRVMIPEEFNVSINCDCKTKTVYALGGFEGEPQRVMIPTSSKCGIPQRSWSLDVLAAGATQIEVKAVVNHPNRVYISIASFNQVKLNVEASVRVASGIGFTLQLNGLDWMQDRAINPSETLDVTVYYIKLRRTSSSDVIDLKLAYTGSLGSDWYLSEPPITVEASSGGEHNKNIFIEKITGIAKVQHLLGEDKLPGEYSGYLGLPNIFLVVNGGGKIITGGYKDDVFWIETDDFKNMIIDGGTSGVSVNTISFEAGGAPVSSKTLTVDLASNETYFSSADKAVVKNIQRVWGRSSLPDIIIAGCNTIDINGRGGVSASYDNISFQISDKCSWAHVTVQVPEYTNVFNRAQNGRFSYEVNDMDTSNLHLSPTINNEHIITILQHPSEVITALSFNISTSKLQFKTLKTQALHEFQMVGVENNAFKNPIIQFKSNGSEGDDIVCRLWVTTSGNVHTIFTIRKISSGILVHGLPANVNNFVINITERAEKSSGVIQGPPTFTKNSFVIHNLESPLELLDGNGECSENKNEIIFLDKFQPAKRLIVNMQKMENGFVRTRINSTSDTVIKKLKNIDVLVGRENPALVDEVLPNCRTTSVKFFEDIKIIHDPKCESDTGYNLEMGIDKKTKVTFLAPKEDLASDDDPIEGVFRYKFSTPRSFNIKDSDNVVDGEHIYYLPFNITRLVSLSFSKETKTISYSVTQTAYSKTLVNCSHKIISIAGQNNPFYHQPKLITQEGYLIQVSLAGSIFITKSSGTYSLNTDGVIRTSNLTQLLSLSTKLSVSIIAKLDDENVVYVGHASDGNKNVLQNSVKNTSHLVNNQASDTVYDIVALERNVFIYPGFNSLTNDTQNDVIQVVDLTSIVRSIETNKASDSNYMPTISKDGSDLVITMKGHEKSYPGKVRIVNCPDICFRRLKARFRSSDMSITTSAGWGAGNPVGSRKKRSTYTEWNFHPDPIIIPAGYVYFIAPEDLEVGQEILFQEEKSSNGTATSTATSFQMIKNGTDLIFTSMKSAQKRGEVESTTTVIMSRFYETSNLLTTRDDLSAGNNDTATGLGDQLLRSKKILQVTINFPSLHVILNDTKIEPIVTLGPLGGRVQQPAAEPDTWNNLLDDVERAILRGLRDIPIKRKFETNRKRIWFRYNQV